jgi:hypothetical protein
MSLRRSSPSLGRASERSADIGEPSGGAFLERMMQKNKLKFPTNSKPSKELEAMCR